MRPILDRPLRMGGAMALMLWRWPDRSDLIRLLALRWACVRSALLELDAAGRLGRP